MPFRFDRPAHVEDIETEADEVTSDPGEEPDDDQDQR